MGGCSIKDQTFRGRTSAAASFPLTCSHAFEQRLLECVSAETSFSGALCRIFRKSSDRCALICFASVATSVRWSFVSSFLPSRVLWSLVWFWLVPPQWEGLPGHYYHYD